MANLQNATPFAACALPSSDREGRDLLLIVAAAHFVLPEPGDRGTRLHLAAEQDLPPMAEEHAGDPGVSTIRRDGQSCYTRPATDISIWGDACGRDGKPVREMTVSVRVGPCSVDLSVCGDRFWQPAPVVGAKPSEPAPFLRMPLVWERAYGGVASGSTEEQPAFEPRNPIGCGLETDANDAIGKPVPNIEHPRQRLNRLSDRPRPMGLTPIARQWQPRLGYAGTYDEDWRRARAPLWPVDFDERFFCSAPEYLQASPHLTGGEAVVLQGMHPDGVIAFRLPVLRLAARNRFTDRTLRTLLTLDGVVIETDVKRLTLYYRSAVPADRGLVRHRETLLRLLAPWEDVKAS